MRSMFALHVSPVRRHVHFAPKLLLVVLFVAACSGSADRSVTAPASGEKPRTEVATPVAASEAREATVGAAANAGEAGGSSRVPFIARREAHGGSSYEADTILAVRYGTHEGYERVVLDLGTGDEPAETVPQWTLMRPKGDGLLRVTFPSVSATGVSDGGFGEGLLKSFYVVRAPEDGMFVDVFARRAFAYRVLELSAPARLVVDFKPTGEPLKVPLPAVGGKTVLVEPRAGARIADPLTVSGYSRNFEASNTIVLANSRGKVLARQTVLSNDWSSTWGYFEATLDFLPFGGKGIVRVGSGSARDGTFQGVEIPIRGS
jgi:Immunoglobulin-like domain of bacterial spore germination